jgi:hypothetical protein
MSANSRSVRRKKKAPLKNIKTEATVVIQIIDPFKELCPSADQRTPSMNPTAGLIEYQVRQGCGTIVAGYITGLA